MTTIFNTAVTETASGILGKHYKKKNMWVTAEILDLCYKRRELRKNRFEPEGTFFFLSTEVRMHVQMSLMPVMVILFLFLGAVESQDKI